MNKITTVREKVDRLYRAKDKNRDEWADWLYGHHVLLVADWARKLARRYGADAELSEAAALLHDIADAVMSRDNPKHQEESKQIARRFLKESGFNDGEVKTVVDDALRFHSCHGSERPRTLEGKVLASADSVSHLRSDFFAYALAEKRKSEPLEEISKWVLEKIDRELNSKIAFDDLREELRPDYEKIRPQFSALK